MCGLSFTSISLTDLAPEIIVQILIVFFGGTAFRVTTLSRREWGLSLVLGAASIPLGALVRLLPNYPFECLFISMHLLPNTEVLPISRPGVGEPNISLTFPNLRGQRLANISCPAPAHVHRDHSVQHVCETLTGIPLDVGPPAWRPSRPSQTRIKASVIVAALSLALTFIGIVLTGVQISGTKA